MRRQVGVWVLVLVALTGCAKSDCTRARDALGATADRLAAGSPEVSGGDLRTLADDLGTMSTLVGEEVRRLEAVVLDDEIGPIMATFVGAMRDLVLALDETEAAARAIVAGEAKLARSVEELGTSYAALQRACDAADEPCSLEGDIRLVTQAIESQQLLLIRPSLRRLERNLLALEPADEGVQTQQRAVAEALDAIFTSMQAMTDAERTVGGVVGRIGELDLKALTVGQQLTAICGEP